MNAPAPERAWPRAIVLVYVVFALALAAVVLIVRRGRDELVAPDYYARELRHEQQLERERRGLAADYAFACDEAARRITLRVPPGGPVTGQVQLYRPSDAAMDRTLPLAVDTGGVMVVDLRDCAAGPWRVLVDWQQGGVEYSREHRVVLP
jgi:hypothetical protein